MAAGLVGCATDPSVTTSDELLTRNNGSIPNGTMIANDAGHSTTISSQGSINLNNEFFQNLGTNGRRCISCHLPTAGWTITPEQMQATFDKTDGGVKDDDFGLGAAFRTNDGSNRPDADVSTLEARRAAYNMLLTKGLIRVGIGIPAGAEFTLDAVDDPYGYASATELSLFRRPLPSTNLNFLSTVMWDGRENIQNPLTGGAAAIHFDLSDQSNGATLGHAAAANPLTNAQRESIVAFETSLATAQESDNGAGSLNAGGATGGAEAIASQAFYIGINDNTGDYQTSAPFTTHVFNLYDAWATNKTAARRAVERGQEIFNSRTFTISGVAGLNGATLPHAPGPLPASFSGTCTTCHNSPNAGDHSIPAPLNIGLVDESRRTADMPLYTLKCTATGQTFKVTDPGRALITGKCADIGKFKGPILRGLSARAPYFHNGSAASLEDAVDFYNTRFNIGLSAQDKSDLAAFLSTL